MEEVVLESVYKSYVFFVPCVPVYVGHVEIPHYYQVIVSKSTTLIHASYQVLVIFMCAAGAVVDISYKDSFTTYCLDRAPYLFLIDK